jgi:hypothetical protein
MTRAGGEVSLLRGGLVLRAGFLLYRNPPNQTSVTSGAADLLSRGRFAAPKPGKTWNSALHGNSALLGGAFLPRKCGVSMKSRISTLSAVTQNGQCALSVTRLAAAPPFLLREPEVVAASEAWATTSIGHDHSNATSYRLGSYLRPVRPECDLLLTAPISSWSRRAGYVLIARWRVAVGNEEALLYALVDQNSLHHHYWLGD